MWSAANAAGEAAAVRRARRKAAPRSCRSAASRGVRQLEAELASLPGFRDFCYRPEGPGGECEAPLSPTRLLRGDGGYLAGSANLSALARGPQLLDEAAACAPSFYGARGV